MRRWSQVKHNKIIERLLAELSEVEKAALSPYFEQSNILRYNNTKELMNDIALAREPFSKLRKNLVMLETKPCLLITKPEVDDNE